MPLYEYQCKACQKVHEVMQKFSDSPLSACPDCGGPVSKLVSLGSFALKGQGWYTTDYKRAGKPAGSPDQAAKADATQADAPKSEAAKPAPAALAVPKSDKKSD